LQTSAEAKMFFDNIRYQNSLRPDVGPKWQSKDYKQIERYRRGLVMRLEEIQKQLEALGLNIPAGTLRRWASEGLIPNPKRYQNPEGRGWLSDWPDETLPETLTVHLLKDVLRLKHSEIAELRQAYKKGGENISSNVWGIALTTIKSDGYKTALRRLSFAQNLAAFIAGDPDRLEKFKVLALLPEIIDTERLERDIETGVVTNDNPMGDIFNYLKPEYDKQEE